MIKRLLIAFGENTIFDGFEKWLLFRRWQTEFYLRAELASIDGRDSVIRRLNALIVSWEAGGDTLHPKLIINSNLTTIKTHDSCSAPLTPKSVADATHMSHTSTPSANTRLHTAYSSSIRWCPDSHLPARFQHDDDDINFDEIIEYFHVRGASSSCPLLMLHVLDAKVFISRGYLSR